MEIDEQLSKLLTDSNMDQYIASLEGFAKSICAYRIGLMENGIRHPDLVNQLVVDYHWVWINSIMIGREFPPNRS